MSYITPRSRELVTLIAKAGHVRTISGAVFGGADSSKWDARWFDAVSCIEQQRILEHNSRMSAEIELSKRQR